MLWNQIEQSINDKLKKAGIERRHTLFWEEAMRAGILKLEDVQLLTQLRMLRNEQVHSTSVDRKQVELAVHMAERFLSALS